MEQLLPLVKISIAHRSLIIQLFIERDSTHEKQVVAFKPADTKLVVLRSGHLSLVEVR